MLYIKCSMINRIKYFFTPIFHNQPFWITSLPTLTMYCDKTIFKVGQYEFKVLHKKINQSFTDGIKTKFIWAIRGTKLSTHLSTYQQANNRKSNNKRVNLLRFRSVSFNPFYDYSVGEMVSTPTDLRRRNKEGLVVMSKDESSRNSKRIKKHKKDIQSIKIRKDLEQSIGEIKQGRSFHNEIMENLGAPVEAFNKPKK